jgi:hypothetical protein
MARQHGALRPDPSAAKTVYRRTGANGTEDLGVARTRILEKTSRISVLEPTVVKEWIRERQQHGIDQHDEVWEGVYVVPPLANNSHQALVGGLNAVFHEVVFIGGRGQVFPGANISARRIGWEQNFRCPDIVVVLKDGLAIDCITHWWGGPDFLVEIESPKDETEEKIPFYSKLKVRELLIIHRDTRQLRLYRHNGQELALVKPSRFQGGQWLLSEVVPLAFRRRTGRGGPHIELRRTDSKSGAWSI